MLSIPSLTGHWYIRTGDHNTIIEARPNSPLLDVAMALSMACGVLASSCLVVRFAERRVKLMTMLSIIFLTLHDCINIPAITIFGVQHRYDDGFTYGQSFWFTVCSTMASTSTNITLITDYHKTKDFKHAGSGLTQKQRSLVIIIIVLLCYVSIGSLILAIMLDVSFIDALYFSVVSIETIGFGDLHPSTSAGPRIFICFYIAGGILNLALAVALSRDALLESAVVSFRSRVKEADEKQRERHIRRRWIAAIRWRVIAQGEKLWVDDNEGANENEGPRRYHGQSNLARFLRRVRSSWYDLIGKKIGQWKLWKKERKDAAWKYISGKQNKRLNLEVLSHSQLETAALEAGALLSELVPKDLKLRSMSKHESRGPVESHGRNKTPPTNHWFPSFQTQSSVASSHSLTNVRIGGMASLLGRFALAVTYGQHHEHDHNSRWSSLAQKGQGHIPDTDLEQARDPCVGTEGDGYEITDEDQCSNAEDVFPFSRIITASGHEVSNIDEVALARSLRRERRNAFRARLSVALILFVVFWMAGSAIFRQTEGWTFGSAAYFCFISFTTVGYGDLSPQTPAGRSIFVVWALLGVGTMTILISILAEAYSNTYKIVIKSDGLHQGIAVPRSPDISHNDQNGGGLLESDFFHDSSSTTLLSPKYHSHTKSLASLSTTSSSIRYDYNRASRSTSTSIMRSNKRSMSMSASISPIPEGTGVHVPDHSPSCPIPVRPSSMTSAIDNLSLRRRNTTISSFKTIEGEKEKLESFARKVLELTEMLRDTMRKNGGDTQQSESGSSRINVLLFSEMDKCVRDITCAAKDALYCQDSR